MDRKEEREQFWISVGPESGYLGSIAEETARKNSGGISPDGARLGWENAKDNDYGNGVAEGWDADDIATEYPYGDPCDAATNGKCGDCNCNSEGITCACADADRKDCPCAPCECDPCDCGNGSHRAPCECEPCTCDPCACPPCENEVNQTRKGDFYAQDNSASGGVQVGYVPLFGANNDCSTLPLPGMIPIEHSDNVPLPDVGPEWQNTQE